MATDTMKIEEIDMIKKIQDRLDDADKKVDAIFSGYTIPEYIKDSKDKLGYVLVEIGDDQDKRKKVKEDFAKLQEEIKLSEKDITEDFISMRTSGDKRIEDLSNRIIELEAEFEKQKSTIDAKTRVIEALDADIQEIEAEKVEIQGADGKGGKLAEEEAKAIKARDEAKALLDEIKIIEDKIADIDKRIAELNEANKNTKDPEEFKKNTAEIASLQGDKTILINERQDLRKQHEDKKIERRKCAENADKLKEDVVNLDSEINSKSTSKNTLENELRLMPEVGAELEKTKKEFDKQRVEYNKSVEDMEKSLKEKGIKVKSRREVDEENTKKEEEKKEEKTENKEENKKTSSESQSGPVNNGGNIPNQGDSYPVVTQQQREQARKQANYEFITGYSGNNIGLSSEERMKRIQSELCGRDYEAMTNAFKELQNSPVKLTKQEKQEIKNMMHTDKMHIGENIKNIDAAGLDVLFKLVGITLTDKELDKLNEYSYSMNDKNNGKSGILNGFSDMPLDNKVNFEKAIVAYSKNKANMTEDEKTSFEKYVMTPVKFGTLNEQSNELCKSPVQRLLSSFKRKVSGSGRIVDDIRAAIAKAELPEGLNSNAHNQSNDFTNDLRNQTQTPPHRGSEKNPPETDDYII